MSEPASPQRRVVRAVGVIAAAAACATILVLASVTAAFPSAGVLNTARESTNAAMFAAEAKYVPKGVTSNLDLPYDSASKNSYDRAQTLDAYYPASVAGSSDLLPTVVWIHGGAWIGGSATELTSHLRILASHGYTTIGVNYTLAPAERYPTPVRQIMAALLYVQEHAAALHADPDRVVLAGDSAGAQLAAQTAEAIVDPAYANLIGVAPPLTADRLKGVLLYCGVFDFSLTGVHGSFRRFLQASLLQYTGSTHPGTADPSRTGSVVKYVPKDFPPTFITAGNADPVLAQSTAMVAALKARGTTVDQLFFPADYKPALPHEYEFHLNLKAAKTAFSRMVSFLKAHA
jgi:acetyl esterase